MQLISISFLIKNWRWRKPISKRISYAKLFDIKKSLDVWDIWRSVKILNFKQNHSFGSIERQLGYILISDCFQKFVNYTDVLPALSIDHSLVLDSLSNDNSDNNGRVPWKFNISLVCHEVENKKKLLQKSILQTNLSEIPKQNRNFWNILFWNKQIYHWLLKYSC